MEGNSKMKNCTTKMINEKEKHKNNYTFLNVKLNNSKKTLFKSNLASMVF